MYTLEETIYRPPLEEHSALLEVSVGCSYGRCTFCHYSNGNTPLQLIPTEIIADNLEEMAQEGITQTRMFLTGGNVFAFKTRFLVDLFAFVRQYLPQIKEFCMYSRADDILHKSGEQLKQLKSAGLDTLYVGVESGNDEILKLCNKGETSETIIRALHVLDDNGIRYGLSSILGLGGRELSECNALDTAELYNSVSPASIRVMTLTPMEGTPLMAEVKSGRFDMLTVREVLQEEITLIKNIELGNRCRFVANHVSNSNAVCGWLPEDKEKMLKKLYAALDSSGGGKSGYEPEQW